jgi:hypothetical protein
MHRQACELPGVHRLLQGLRFFVKRIQFFTLPFAFPAHEKFLRLAEVAVRPAGCNVGVAVAVMVGRRNELRLNSTFAHLKVPAITAKLARMKLAGGTTKTENVITTGMRALVAFIFVLAIIIIPHSLAVAVFRTYTLVTLSRGTRE